MTFAGLHIRTERWFRSHVLPLSVLVLLTAPEAHAQAMQDSVKLSAVDSVRILSGVLEKKREDRARMMRIVDALNTVDSVYKVHYPTWIVLDEDLRQRVIRLFRSRIPSFTHNTDVVVIASPDRSQIIELGVGSKAMGRQDVRFNVSDSLRADLLAADYAKRMIDPIVEPPREFAFFGYRPRYAALSLSAFGATLLFNNGGGAEAKLGYEEIGYHFWSAGTVKALALFDRLKLGVILPLTQGKGRGGGTQPLAIRPRLLTGARGIAAEYEYPFSSQLVGTRFSIGEVTDFTNRELYVNQDRIYYVHTVAQLYYSRQGSLGGNHLFTLTGGLGYHQIATADLHSDDRYVITDRDDFVSPVLRVDYVHRGENLYGAGLQYYGSILFVNWWVELIQNFMFIDLKYYSPVFRSAKPWEQPYFFMISPRIQVEY
jgi:hypothetical protein